MGTSLAWITDAVTGQAPVVAAGCPALAFDDQPPLSYAALREAELAAARALARAGVTRGDRVGLLLRNSIDYVVLYLALARLGAISVRLNFRLTAPEVAFILGDSGAKVLIFDTDFVGSVAPVLDELAVVTYVAREESGPGPDWAVPLDEFLAAGAGHEVTFPVLGADDAVTLLYTSGTTGSPKGAIWTHGNTLWFAAMQSMKWGIDGGAVAFTPGPLFHAGSLEVLILPALVNHGVGVTFSSGGVTLERLLDVARAQSATVLLLYSFMVYDFLRLPDLETRVPATLRRIICGGDTLMPWVYDVLAERLPQIELVQVYGLTEGGAISTCLDHGFAQARAGSVGRPLPLSEVKILDEQGRPVATGAVGEIHVRSPSVSPGYWQRPEANAETFVDGWCRTGDLGSVDADGFLTLGGRAKDMIRSGGENVYPAEIEAVLTKAPGVADAAVFAVPDAKYNEVGCAVLIAIEGATLDLDAVRAYCGERLARFKIPKYFVVGDTLPRTASGKVKKFELRAAYAAIGDTA
ncbi:MAG: class I adenylate-forming enzyme family protein [Gammaproteobacteria bacterium]